MKFIECTGAPRIRGQQYGEQAGDEIRRDLELRARSWKSIDAEAFTDRTLGTLDQCLPEVLDELRGIAEGAGVELSQVLLANQVNTFDDDKEDRCTPIILRETANGPLVAKNNDGPLHEEDYPFIIRKIVPDRGLPLIQVTYAGWLSGLDAINGAGVACTHGSVGSAFAKGGARVDIRLKAYALMQSCRSTAEFMAGLSQTPLTGKGFSMAVGDAEGHTAMLDAAVPFVAMRDENRPFAYSTNLYQARGLEEADRRDPEKRKICIFRNGYLRWVAATRPPVDMTTLQDLLRSHEPWGPCRHGGPHGSVTFWSMIGVPRERKLLVSHGAPCSHAFAEYAC